MKKYFMLFAAGMLAVTTIALSSCKKDGDTKDGDKEKKETVDNPETFTGKDGEEVKTTDLEDALVLVFNTATDQIKDASSIDELDEIYKELDEVVDMMDDEYPGYKPSERVMNAMAKCATAYETRKDELSITGAAR